MCLYFCVLVFVIRSIDIQYKIKTTTIAHVLRAKFFRLQFTAVTPKEG
jgi:hypothetical protein